MCRKKQYIQCSVLPGFWASTGGMAVSPLWMRGSFGSNPTFVCVNQEPTNRPPFLPPAFLLPFLSLFFGASDSYSYISLQILPCGDPHTELYDIMHLGLLEVTLCEANLAYLEGSERSNSPRHYSMFSLTIDSGPYCNLLFLLPASQGMHHFFPETFLKAFIP